MRQFFLLFSFLPFFLAAQSDDSEGHAFTFNGGLIGGATASQIHGDGIGGFNKLGVNLGATLEIGRAGKNNIQIGLVYNQKGSKKPPNATAGDYTTWRYRFTYIDLPLTISYTYRFMDILVGIQPSVLIAAEEDFYGVGWDPTGLPIKPYELSAVLGVRTMYSAHSYVFIRLSQSIMAIAPRPENPVGTARWDNRMMNMTVEIGLNYMIGRLKV